jgi:hypothetical protein
MAFVGGACGIDGGGATAQGKNLSGAKNLVDE